MNNTSLFPYGCRRRRRTVRVRAGRTRGAGGSRPPALTDEDDGGVRRGVVGEADALRGHWRPLRAGSTSRSSASGNTTSRGRPVDAALTPRQRMTLVIAAAMVASTGRRESDSPSSRSDRLERFVDRFVAREEFERLPDEFVVLERDHERPGDVLAGNVAGV